MLVSLGLDFRSARLEVRERFHVEEGDVVRIQDALASRGVRESVLTRTCNRVEAYCWWPAAADDSSRPDPGREISRAWVGRDGPEADHLRAVARARGPGESARHLFRVAAGLESQILGDIHILGQLRRDYRDAVEAGRVGSHLHRLFESALRVGKQVKRETQLLARRNGVGSEAARKATERLGRLAGRTCVIVGCGKSGSHAARCLSQLGATDIVLVNRTVERAEKLARDLGNARPEGLEALPRLLAESHLVVVATGAPEPVLTAALLEGVRRPGGKTLCDRPLLVIDVSVPRNVEASVGRMPQVELVDLDSLHPETAELQKSRMAAVPEAEGLVEEGVGEFVHWLELAEARRALRPLHAALSEICRREVSHLAGESPLATRTADRIVASLMAHPMTALRAASKRGEPVEDAIGALGALFAGPRAGGERSTPS